MYEIGSVLAGFITGASLSILDQSGNEFRGQTLRVAIQGLYSRRINRWIQGSKADYAIVGDFVLILVIMTLLGDFAFFGAHIADSKITSIFVMAFVGVVFALIFQLHDLWFGYSIWRNEIVFYVVALLELWFLLAIVSAFSGWLFETRFFVAVIGGQSIVIVLARKYPNHKWQKYGYIGLCVALLIPVFLSL